MTDTVMPAYNPERLYDGQALGTASCMSGFSARMTGRVGKSIVSQLAPQVFALIVWPCVSA